MIPGIRDLIHGIVRPLKQDNRYCSRLAVNNNGFLRIISIIGIARKKIMRYNNMDL